MAAALHAWAAHPTGSDGSWQVIPARWAGAEVDCGLAGTVWFRAPVAALGKGRCPRRATPGQGTAWGGAERLRGRSDHRQRAAVRGPRHRWCRWEVTIDASASSQFMSGLLSGARFGAGHRAAQRKTGAFPTAHRDRGVLRDASAGGRRPADVAGGTQQHPPPRPRRRTDLSTPRSWPRPRHRHRHHPRWPRQTRRPGHHRTSSPRWRPGAAGRGGPTVTGPDHAAGRLGLRSANSPVAALAALADGRSAARHRAPAGPETDRLAALGGLSRLGAVSQTEDGLLIDRASSPAGWHSYADHRMATRARSWACPCPGCSGGHRDHVENAPDFRRCGTACWRRCVDGPGWRP